MQERPSDQNIPESIGDELIRHGIIGGEDVNAALASQFGMPIISQINQFNLSQEIYDKVPYSFVKRHVVLPYDQEDGFVVVAVSDPLNLDPLQDLRYMLNLEIKAVYAPREAVLSAINECYNTETGAASKLIAEISEKRSADGGEEEEVETYDLLDDRRDQAPVVKLLNLILTEAIQQRASDIHFEPYESGLRVRYRIDGVLQSRHSPAPEYQGPLMTRVKVISRLDIAERRLPQDGRIKLKMGRREIDFRVSTVPVAGGERIVLRILDKGNVMLGLTRLGMLPHDYNEFRRLIKMPEGIVLVTGPTGSGKTTTLYSGINDLYNDEINIMTIEDPVEYNLKGIAQIGVQHKINLDFARGLRHILRQDPDVVMVGEIRDFETAEIAIQAALTGHLVLSTLHTNDAPSAITRLVDMGVEPYLLSSSVIGVLAQRLVRRICPNCRRAIDATAAELASIGLNVEDLPDGVVYEGAGCDNCLGSGYRGRHGAYELMTVNNEIRKQIVKSPDSVILREIALRTGMTSLRHHGSELVKQGITTIAEVMRVTRAVEAER
ncbi:MAG: type II secretion system ATPase GspE [Chlamydiales bacterium]|nr:type II secretion system ATPase GspE [Chlamydiales bacterium]